MGLKRVKMLATFGMEGSDPLTAGSEHTIDSREADRFIKAGFAIDLGQEDEAQEQEQPKQIRRRRKRVETRDIVSSRDAETRDEDE